MLHSSKRPRFAGPFCVSEARPAGPRNGRRDVNDTEDNCRASRTRAGHGWLVGARPPGKPRSRRSKQRPCASTDTSCRQRLRPRQLQRDDQHGAYGAGRGHRPAQPTPCPNVAHTGRRTRMGCSVTRGGRSRVAAAQIGAWHRSVRFADDVPSEAWHQPLSALASRPGGRIVPVVRIIRSFRGAALVVVLVIAVAACGEDSTRSGHSRTRAARRQRQGGGRDGEQSRHRRETTELSSGRPRGKDRGDLNVATRHGRGVWRREMESRPQTGEWPRRPGGAGLSDPRCRRPTRPPERPRTHGSLAVEAKKTTVNGQPGLDYASFDATKGPFGLAWTTPEGQIIDVFGFGASRAQIRAAAESLRPIDHAAWAKIEANNKTCSDVPKG